MKRKGKKVLDNEITHKGGKRERGGGGREEGHEEGGVSEQGRKEGRERG